MRCRRCHHEMTEGMTTWDYEIAGQVYAGEVPALVCGCPGRSVRGQDDLAAFDASVCDRLVECAPSGDAFRFIRRTMGMGVRAVAAQLGVTPTAICRMERDGVMVEGAWAWLVGVWARDRADHGAS